MSEETKKTTTEEKPVAKSQGSEQKSGNELFNGIERIIITGYGYQPIDNLDTSNPPKGDDSE